MTMDGLRINRAERRQPAFELVDLEALVPDDHRVRSIWSFVEALDLSMFYDRIKARGEAPGRPASDPRVLLALWLYATAEGIGSARALERLCDYHVIYRWVCGGVGVNHALLSAFRINSGAFLDQLMTRTLAALIEEGLINLDEVITDGTKVRASASLTSMRHKPRIEQIEADLTARIATLKQELDADPATAERRRKSRQLAAAKERARRVSAALGKFAGHEKEAARRAETHPGAAAKSVPDEPRVSLSDPDARSMRMADGAVRPCYNVQVATASGFIIALEPTDRRNDRGLAPEVIKQVERRCGAAPRRLLADLGAMTETDIKGFADSHPGMQIYAPPKACAPNAKPESRVRYERKLASQPDCLKAWRTRMQGPEGKAVYKRRSNTEHAHAGMKNCGFGRMPVRGMANVRTVCLLHAIVYNMNRAIHRRSVIAA
jgi:transposase